MVYDPPISQFSDYQANNRIQNDCSPTQMNSVSCLKVNTFRLMLRISLTMKREIQNASYRLFINNESTSLTMSVSTYRLIVSELRSISRNVPLGISTVLWLS